MPTLRAHSPFLLKFPFLITFLLISTVAQAQTAPKAPEGMVYIPDGYFQMGSASGTSKDEHPLHFVYTSAYFIDKLEVSNREYGKFMEATGHPAPAFWEDARFNTPDQPVVGVSWYDAMEYSKWKGRRLPTEAEWEKAARGNDGRMYPWGQKWALGFHLFFINVYGIEDNFEFTAPVTSFESGASPFGVLNMAGNVWEWCMDWYDEDYYHISPELDPKGPDNTSLKVVRGGGWVNSIDDVQVVRRGRNRPHVKNNLYGFRTVLPLPKN